MAAIRAEKPTDTRHNEDGEELLNPTPMQPPLGYKRAPTLAEQIRHQVMVAKLEALNDLEETEDEADDFEVGDDFEPMSKYENDHIPTIKQLRQQAQEINDKIRHENLKAAKAQLEKQIKEKRGGAAPAASAADEPSSETGET